eukprot:scaffold76267_cov33-Tisochrysis_lutea.AAC.1
MSVVGGVSVAWVAFVYGVLRVGRVHHHHYQHGGSPGRPSGRPVWACSWAITRTGRGGAQTPVDQPKIKGLLHGCGLHPSIEHLGVC